MDCYRGDTCATLAVGEPGEEFRKAHKVVREAMGLGLQAIRPGIPAAEEDSVMRDHLQHCGYDTDRHCAHGIGVTHFEPPILMPFNTQPLERNMVVALEPAVHVAGPGTIGLEHMVRVTGGGAELLSSHSIEP